MKIAIGSDHRGFEMKQFFVSQAHVAGVEIEWVDVGALTQERSDYPVYSREVVRLLQEHAADAGVLICGSGVGMAIAANRFKNIYAAVLWSVDVARVAREDDNVNVLVFPSDFITKSQALECLSAWLKSSFKGNRYAKRLAMLD